VTSSSGDGPDGAVCTTEAGRVVELGSVNTQVVAPNSAQAQDKTADPAVAIVVAPADRRGSYSATLDGRRLITSSRQPFCDAARRLLGLGYDPSLTLEMWRPGAASWDLCAPLWAVAKLAVKHSRFVRYLEAANLAPRRPSIAQNGRQLSKVPEALKRASEPAGTAGEADVYWGYPMLRSRINDRHRP
jgi:hypothetical protein